MAYEQKPNTGSLFKNERKEADTHPDYKGSALIDGLGECWLDAWINTAKDGSKYMSVKIKPKNADQRGSYARTEPTQARGFTGSYHGDPRTNSSGGTHQPVSQFDDDSEVPF